MWDGKGALERGGAVADWGALVVVVSGAPGRAFEVPIDCMRSKSSGTAPLVCLVCIAEGHSRRS